MATASIIIPVYNHATLTRECVKSILACPPVQCGYEIVVVDDGSAIPVQEALLPFGERSERSEHIRSIRNVHNKGFAMACNAGAAATSTDFLVFLNNDTIPQRGWLDALVGYAQAHPDAAVVGGKLVYPNNTIQHAGIVICQDRYPRHVYTGFPAEHPAVNKARRFQSVTAACVLIRRTAFEQVGGFDSDFRNGYEDVDLCLRLRQLDYEVHYCPESVVIHLESITRGDLPSSTAHNDSLYRERWSTRVRPDEMDYYIEDGLLELTFAPGEGYPAHLKVSPLLAVLDRTRDSELEHLLNSRARQVFDLIKENIRLGEFIREADLALERGADEAPADSVVSQDDQPSARRPG